MLFIKTDRRITKNSEGFTLIELIVVIAIISILAAVLVGNYAGYVKEAKESICNTNCVKLERMYQAHLDMKNIQHSDLVFEQYLQKYGKIRCPDHGVISYVNGKVQCSVHIRENDSENNDADVPFLD